MKENGPVLSIVTPTYNRGHLMENCYNSLCNQTSFEFEWIVVDDGSIDDTKVLIQQLKNRESRFPIIFLSKENGGKHTALNYSHDYIHGKYVLILDSDDVLTEEAVETVLREWSEYENNSEIGMLVFNKITQDGKLCAYAKDEYVPVDYLHYKRICVASSDCCEVLRTELFVKYPFPVFEGEKFLAETALWYRAATNHRSIFTNKVVYICEYLEDGLTKSGKNMRLKNPNGGMYTSYLRMNKRCFLSERIRAGLLYVCYGYFAKVGIREMFKKAKPHCVLSALCFVPGTMLYLMWKKKYF